MKRLIFTVRPNHLDDRAVRSVLCSPQVLIEPSYILEPS